MSSDSAGPGRQGPGSTPGGSRGRASIPPQGSAAGRKNPRTGRSSASGSGRKPGQVAPDGLVASKSRKHRSPLWTKITIVLGALMLVATVGAYVAFQAGINELNHSVNTANLSGTRSRDEAEAGRQHDRRADQHPHGRRRRDRAHRLDHDRPLPGQSQRGLLHLAPPRHPGQRAGRRHQQDQRGLRQRQDPRTPEDDPEQLGHLRQCRHDHQLHRLRGHRHEARRRRHVRRRDDVLDPPRLHQQQPGRSLQRLPVQDQSELRRTDLLEARRVLGPRDAPTSARSPASKRSSTPRARTTSTPTTRWTSSDAATAWPAPTTAASATSSSSSRP